MRKYNWLLFDLDNTLLDFGQSSKEAFFTIFEPHGYTFTAEDYKDYNVINHKAWVDLEKGLLTPEVLKTRRWQLFFEEKGLSLDPAAINEAYFEIGIAKPAISFFDHVMQVIGQPLKEEILIIGDTLTSDIRGGIDYGIDTCWYNYYGKENTTQYHPTYELSDIRDLVGLLDRAKL